MNERARTAQTPVMALMMLLLSAIVIAAPARSAFACGKDEKTTGLGRIDIHIKCHGENHTGDYSGGGNGGSSQNGETSVHTKSPKETYADKVAAIRKRNEQAREDYITAVKQRNDHYRTGECVYRAGGSFTGANCATPKRPKMIPIPKPPKGVPAPNLPPIPPEEAAYLAIATKLRINASGIGIGPDPDLSRWKMAVVGHSYWLWATGPTHLGPVSDSASGRTVTLNATLASVTFEMGDGGIIKCKGAGTPYPGDKKGLYAKSPTCGYTYQTTSKHHAGGTYPVRATTYWSVAYSTPDGSGVIPIVLASERDLKVGELQTVITH